MPNANQALALINMYGPEHLIICSKDEEFYVSGIENAGSVFIGSYAPVSFGDYIAGTNHVLPTGGTARFSSGLNVNSFLKISPLIAVDKDVARELSLTASLIARAEGLTAHAEAAEVSDEMLGE